MALEDTFGFDVDFDPRPTLGASEADPVDRAPLAKQGPSATGGPLALAPLLKTPADFPQPPRVQFEFVRYSPRVNHLGPDASLMLVRTEADPSLLRWLWMTDDQVDHNIGLFGARPAFLQAKAARQEWFAHSPSYRRRRR